MAYEDDIFDRRVDKPTDHDKFPHLMREGISDWPYRQMISRVHWSFNLRLESPDNILRNKLKVHYMVWKNVLLSSIDLCYKILSLNLSCIKV